MDLTEEQLLDMYIIACEESGVAERRKGDLFKQLKQNGLAPGEILFRVQKMIALKEKERVEKIHRAELMEYYEHPTVNINLLKDLVDAGFR